MRLGKYLSSLTKPELEGIKNQLCLSDEEEIIFKMLQKQKSITEISNYMNISEISVKRRCKKLNDKIERIDNNKKIPIWEKLNLTIEEAAEYSNIGICKMQELAKEPMCPFVLYVGRKKLIKRKEFEKYLEKTLEI